MVSLHTTSNLLAQSIRAHRESRGLSMGALAEKAGIAKTSLSKIEAGQGNPSLEVLCRIASALSVPVGDLFAKENQPQLYLVRKDEGRVAVSDSGLRIRTLLVEGRNQRTEIYEMLVPAGATYHSLAHAPGCEEFVVCSEGDLRLGPEGQEVLLQPGDAVRFPGDLPHSYSSNTGACSTLIMHYPPAAGISR
ncbi:XRE family transcriptional regulator [Ktedonosporobacter rubrisoli]|uniref:XRE family transcriptional regulator n=1 Tax=Ktedonosporobacter rubrisoli TaxID=2509675 RepID=A0A4P6JUN3_KTERU|nr:XRE family transcriptional regulator [Ktedonosporobacter rubrisoli]QBD79065.1 XRE family transcriptional regulator [Ktedonosporobacter rubrisoli]